MFSSVSGNVKKIMSFTFSELKRLFLCGSAVLIGVFSFSDLSAKVVKKSADIVKKTKIMKDKADIRKNLRKMLEFYRKKFKPQPKTEEYINSLSNE